MGRVCTKRAADSACALELSAIQSWRNACASARGLRRRWRVGRPPSPGRSPRTVSPAGPLGGQCETERRPRRRPAQSQGERVDLLCRSAAARTPPFRAGRCRQGPTWATNWACVERHATSHVASPTAFVIAARGTGSKASSTSSVEATRLGCRSSIAALLFPHCNRREMRSFVLFHAPAKA